MYQYYNFAELFQPDEIIDYLRKSQSDDPLLTVEEVLQRHETILDEWDERHLTGKVPEQNRFREVVSGETIKERPEINKVLKLIESPKYKAVKVIEPQRLTRGDLEDIGRMMKILKLTNTFIITPERTYDLQDEYDWNAFEAELKRGNDYLKYTKKILNRGRLASVGQGNYIGSVPPYGYNKIWITENKKKYPTLEENREEADTVRLIFDLYVNKNMGYAKICDRLDSMNIPPQKGEHWSPAFLADMLSNVHYVGKVKWNHRKTVSVVENGEIKKTRPKSKADECLIFDGKHNGIVSDKIFQAAQEKKGTVSRIPKKATPRNAFVGLLYCECGRAMSYKQYFNSDGTERGAPRLLCNSQKYCGNGSCLYSDVVDKVKSILQQNISDFEISLKNQKKENTDMHAQNIKDLEKQLKFLQQKELSIWESQTHPDISQRMPPEVFKQLNLKLQSEKQEVQKALRKAYAEKPEYIDYAERLQRFKDALAALENPDLGAETQNQLLKSCITRIEYRRAAPERLKKEPGEKKGTRFKSAGGRWSNPPIEINVTLKI